MHLMIISSREREREREREITVIHASSWRGVEIGR